MLVREGDVDSLAEAAALVLSDPEEFQARRRSGLALAPERTWTCVARKQAELYRMALEAGRTPLLPGSPRARRRLAEAEFGRPAEALGQSRPFALPYLRRPSATSRMLGRTMDMLAEVRTKISASGVTSISARDDRLIDGEQRDALCSPVSSAPPWRSLPTRAPDAGRRRHGFCAWPQPARRRHRERSTARRRCG